MKAEYDTSNATKNPFTGKLSKLSAEQLRKTSRVEAQIVSTDTTEYCEDGTIYKKKDIKLSV